MDAAEEASELARLQRKLSRAERKGKDDRARELQMRISALVRAPALSKSAEDTEGTTDGGAVAEEAERLARKLARAERKGDVDRVAQLRARLAVADAAGRGAASGGATGASAAGGAATSAAAADPHEGMVYSVKTGKWYPKPSAPVGNTSLLLFYAYVQPPWSPTQRKTAIEFTRSTLSTHGCTGRLRVSLEGFNGTLSGPGAGVRSFCEALRAWDPQHFSNVDFKIVDGQPDNRAFRELKVWPVDTLVNYGFDSTVAPLTLGGTHVSPAEWTRLAGTPGAVMVDVRNANETAIGRFEPPAGGAALLDPLMRRSTEFNEWVDSNIKTLKTAPKVLMYCTAGIRCERASALLAAKGVPQDSIFQLDGGIHRYLDAYPEDGGIWAGKN